MDENSKSIVEKSESQLIAVIGAKAGRKISAKSHPKKELWFGLGMMGLVGWSVVVPTLLGAGIGLWIDSKHPGGRSWTLALLIGGLAIGCLNAWHWITQEDQAMHEDDSDE